MLQEYIDWFFQIVNISNHLYFDNEHKFQDIKQIVPPENQWLEEVTGKPTLSFEEKVVVLLALAPHICPQQLDIFYKINYVTNRYYTEFGGWKGITHSGFLPTGETAVFILAGKDIQKRVEVCKLFRRDYWLYKENIIRLEGAGEGEPFLSGQLRISDEFLSKVLFQTEYKVDYSVGFPAKRITTELEWKDLILDYEVAKELEDINSWMIYQSVIMKDWGLSRYLKAGYRALFYGPPGTGKTLAATLLGKKNDMDVYRVDLSMIVSKYIGETEKNLAHVFDLAENRRWILFFDEADALFGKRTSTNNSNDRHANQEVAYLLQRIEDFPGVVIIATNLRSNIDEAFSRRFQSTVYFPMPTEEQRRELWKNMIPKQWIGKQGDDLIALAAKTELSGGSITNVVRRCALQILASGKKTLDIHILKDALLKEKSKS